MLKVNSGLSCLKKQLAIMLKGTGIYHAKKDQSDGKPLVTPDVLWHITL